MTVERFDSRSAVVADVRRRLHASFLCSGDQFDVERIVDDCFRVSGGAWVQVVSDSAFWLAATSYAYPDVVAGRLIIESLGFPVSLVRWSVVQGHGPRPVVLDSGVVVGVHRAVDSLVFATVRRLGWHPGVALELGRVRSFSVSYAHGSVASKRFYRQGRHVSTRERKAEWLRTVKGLGEFESVDARLEFYDDLIPRARIVCESRHGGSRAGFCPRPLVETFMFGGGESADEALQRLDALLARRGARRGAQRGGALGVIGGGVRPPRVFSLQGHAYSFDRAERAYVLRPDLDADGLRALVLDHRQEMVDGGEAS